MFSDQTFIDFLELSKHVTSLLVKCPDLIGSHTETRSVMDLHYWSDAGMLMLVTADLSSFLEKSGFFSFGKKKETIQTPGSIAGYSQGKTDEKQIGDYNFKQEWWINYPTPSAKAAWSSKLEMLVCGEDSGMMHFVKPCATNMLKCEELFFIKVHSERLTAIDIDDERKLVYSVAEDRKFKVVDLNKKTISSEFEASSKKIHCMQIDKKDRIAYVGDGEGNVKIIDLSKNPPTCINNIKVSSKDSVVAINLANNMIYSACGESGKIYVHTLGDVKDTVDQNITQSTFRVLKYSFTSYKGVTAMYYWKERDELYVGHSNGIVAVFTKYVSIDFPFCSNYSN